MCRCNHHPLNSAVGPGKRPLLLDLAHIAMIANEESRCSTGTTMSAPWGRHLPKASAIKSLAVPREGCTVNLYRLWSLLGLSCYSRSSQEKQHNRQNLLCVPGKNHVSFFIQRKPVAHHTCARKLPFSVRAGQKQHWLQPNTHTHAADQWRCHDSCTRCVPTVHTFLFIGVPKQLAVLHGYPIIIIPQEKGQLRPSNNNDYPSFLKDIRHSVYW